MSIEALILASGCFSGATVAGWTVDPAVVAPLAFGLMLYLVGVARLWRSAGWGRGASPLKVALFVAGWLLMAVALLSPLHEWSRRLFAAHMIEHELVMAVAAPLLVLSQPLGVLLWAFPAAWRRQVARGTQTTAYLLGWDVLSRPLVATVVHGLAIWVWHVPLLFDAALGNEFLHWLQHLSFFVSAMLFWWAMFGQRQQRGAAIGFLFLSGLHTGFLGVLLTLAPRPIYPLQAELAAAFGANPLNDQQLAGLIMWVPAGFSYVAAGLVLAGLWVGQSSLREPSHV